MPFRPTLPEARNPPVPKGRPQAIRKGSLRARARTHIANKDYDSAIADLTDLIRNGSSNWQDFALRGLAYHRKSQPDSALEDYNRAISQNGHEASTHYNRALIYAQKGNLDTALSDLDAAIDQHGGMDTEFLFERGRIHTRKSMHAQAVADYSKAIDVLSKDKTAHE
jgi:tetratricopeptide (TPR) repeat protein